MNTYSAMTAAVYTATAIGGAWTLDSWANCDDLHLRLAPTISFAALSRPYGELVRGGVTTTVAPVDYRGRFIKIILTGTGGTQTWYGYCPAMTDAINQTYTNAAGATINCGEQQFTVYGMEWWLTQYEVASLWQFESTAGPTLGDALNNVAVPTLNRIGPGTNRRVVGNRSNLTMNTVGVYGLHDSATNRWSAATALPLLLKQFEVLTGLTVTLAGQTSALAEHTQVWDFRGDTYWQALNEVLAPEFGYACYVTASDALVLTLTVKSISDAAVTSGATTIIPANDEQFALNLHQTPGIARASIRQVENAHYDYVRVQGAPLRVAFTLSGSLLQRAWVDADQTNYAAQVSDAVNRRATWNGVYCRFTTTRDLLRASSPNVIPAITPATGAVDLATYQPGLLKNWRIEPTLPWDDTGLGAGDDGVPQPARLVVLGKDGNDEYFHVDAPRIGTRYPSSGVSALDHQFGIEINPPYQHLFAQDEYTGTGGGLGVGAALFRWQDLVISLSAYTEDPVRIYGATATPEPGPVDKVKAIHLPDCHLWYVAPGTVTGMATATTLSTHAGGYTRDDRWLLQRVFDFAQVWYARRRSQVEVQYSFAGIFDRLGQMVSETATGAATVPTGTLVTQIDHDLAGQKTSFRTEWYDLDWGRYAATLRERKGALWYADMARAGERWLRQVVHQPTVSSTPDPDSYYDPQYERAFFRDLDRQVPAGHTLVNNIINIPHGTDATVYLGLATLSGTAWDLYLSDAGLAVAYRLAAVKTSGTGRLLSFTRYTRDIRLPTSGASDSIALPGGGTIVFNRGAFVSFTP